MPSAAPRQYDVPHVLLPYDNCQCVHVHSSTFSFENYKYIPSLSFSFLLPLSSPLTTELDMAEKHDTPTSSVDINQSQAPPKDPSLTGVSPKAIIKNVDMSEEMQQDSVDIASAALEKYNIEKDIAAQIKKEFDRRHGPTWHVVVGKNFGSYVTHGMPPDFSFWFIVYVCLQRRVSMSIIWNYFSINTCSNCPPRN